MTSVVTAIEEATASWVTAALAERFPDIDVQSIRARAIGTGQMSDTYLLELDVTSGPSSVVLKLAPQDETTRTRAASGYSAELDFYREVSGRLSIRTPTAYLAIESEQGSRFNLLLEHIAPAIQPDQIAGTGLDVINSAASALAGLHAPTWCDENLWKRPWAVRFDSSTARYLGTIYGQAMASFEHRFAERLDAADLATIREAGEWLEPFLINSGRSFAATHGDYRLDNLLVTPGRGVVAVDWQTVGVGLPARDLAYLISTSFEAAERRAHEREVIEIYQQALHRSGVEGYSLEECEEDYRFGLLQAPLVIVLGAAFSTATERGDAMFTVMGRRAAAAIRDHRRLED
jgi:hypothetical protein